MRRYLLLFLALAFAGWGANVRLYLTDGTYQLVREYKVQTDRIRFYSVERGDWEEIPLDMVDLKRTESESKERQAQLERDTKILTEEDNAMREQEKEIRRIPEDPGVYWLENNQAKVMKMADTSVHTNKGRSILKAISPIPMVSGKATLEIDGAHATQVFTNPEQEFYFQLSATQRFGIAKLTPKGAVRIVENLTTLPVVNEVEEEREMVPVFQKQLTGDGLYKVWPREPMPPGEYAVVEYTDGKVNIRVWDFAVKPAK
jgi:hypothetical protein